MDGNGQPVAARMLVVAMAALPTAVNKPSTGKRGEENNQLLWHADIKAILVRIASRNIFFAATCLAGGDSLKR
jgi:hypothetical protein